MLYHNTRASILHIVLPIALSFDKFVLEVYTDRGSRGSGEDDPLGVCVARVARTC